MPDINIEEDLTSINEQIVKVVDELNKVNQARDSLVQQIQNLSGVAMYLRGKMPQSETVEGSSDDNESVERSVGVPEEIST